MQVESLLLVFNVQVTKNVYQSSALEMGKTERKQHRHPGYLGHIPYEKKVLYVTTVGLYFSENVLKRKRLTIALFPTAGPPKVTSRIRS